MSEKNIEQHNIEIQKNLKSWQKKPVLRLIYEEFYKQIHKYINYSIEGHIVELGSGIGNIKTEIPDAISTDIFNNPWIDQTENAYQLSFEYNSVSNLILFDVFHHLEYPGNAFSEFFRVLKPGGRVIIFDPSISVTGFFIYGLMHHEPVAILKKIHWLAPENYDPWNSPYYAAQGNAERIFFGKKFLNNLRNWDMVEKKKFSALAYILSGGYSKPQMFSAKNYSIIKRIEKALDKLPVLFSSRLLVVLQKKDINNNL